MERRDKWDWLVFPTVRSAVGHMAGLAGYAAVAVAVFSILDPILWFIIGTEGLANVLSNSSDILFCLWLALLGVLGPWSHIVLVAGRGFVVSRWACLLGVILSILLFCGTLYSCFTQEVFLSYQLDLPLYLAMIWFGSCLLNINNIAAAPLAVRILLPCGFFLLILCGLTLGIYELTLFYKVFKTAACLVLFRPLLQLRKIAPFIPVLPEVEEH